jgi:hypothetical protein
MVQLFLQYHKHDNSLNISAFVHPLPAKKRRSKVLGPVFFKSHAFPHMKNFKYNQNTPEKKKCRTFSRYSNWLYWAIGTLTVRIFSQFSTNFQPIFISIFVQFYRQLDIICSKIERKLKEN